MTNTTTKRVVYSLGATGLYAVANVADSYIRNDVTLDVAKESVKQLDNTDNPALMTYIQHSTDIGLPTTLLYAAAMGYIWRKPIRNLIIRLLNDRDTLMAAAAAPFAALTIGAALPDQAHAYYDTRDLPEFVEISPNETAFAVPAQGANKDTQGKFGSEQYYTENKVAAKRYQIPHTEITMPGLTRNRYVPSTRLYIVERTPVMREWLKDNHRGTSQKEEDFRVESADSVDISVGVTIAASIPETTAAKYLYNFGVLVPKANPNANEEERNAKTFASVYYARSLDHVMDTVVRSSVQSILAKEFGKRTTKDCIGQKAQIMDALESGLRQKYETMGIRIDNIGFATGLNFGNPAVQQAIDASVANQYKAAAATALGQALPVMKAEADIKFKEAMGEAVKKWDGKVNLPSFLFISDGLVKWLDRTFGSNDNAQRAVETARPVEAARLTR